VAHKSLRPEEQRQQALFRWPAGIEKGALPWEASAAALELLRWRDELPANIGGGRPTIREVKWFYRLRLAAPSLPIGEASARAQQLAFGEYADVVNTSAKVDVGLLDLRLAYRPWESPEHQAAWVKAAERHGQTEASFAVIAATGSLDDLQPFLAMFHGEREAQMIKGFLEQRLAERRQEEEGTQ
jgi:hypothetical protein